MLMAREFIFQTAIADMRNAHQTMRNQKVKITVHRWLRQGWGYALINFGAHQMPARVVQNVQNRHALAGQAKAFFTNLLSKMLG